MKRILPILILGLLLLTLDPAVAQTLQPDYGAPTTPVDVCNGNAVFRVKIVGGSVACSQGTLNLTLPAGYIYAPATAAISDGSGNVTETSVSGNTAILTIQNIPAAPGFTEISYQASATCAVLASGLSVNNQVNYSFYSPCATPTSVTSNSFNTQSASLTITNITNSSYFGAAGDNYTRTITIMNNGFGSISRVTLADTSGSGLSIKGISVSGGWTFTTSKVTVGTDTVTTFELSGGQLAQGQSITLIENVTMVNNCDLQSRFVAWFGCDSAPCTNNDVSGKATAGATVNNSYLPSLKVIPDLLPIQCRETDYAQVLRLTNIGSAKLNDLSLTLFSTASNQPASLQNFDPAAPASSQSAFGNFQYKVGLNSAWASLSPAASANFSTPASCFGAFSGNLSFHFPVINPGDTLYIRYTEKNCSVISAANGELVTAGTLLRYDYEAPCGGKTDAVSSLLRAPLITRIKPDASLPASMVAGQSYSFNYRFPEAQTDLYTVSGPNPSSVRFVLSLPSNVVFSGNAADVHLKHPVSGAVLAAPGSFNYNPGTHTVELTYFVSPSFPVSSFKNAILGFDNMTLDCNLSSSGNTVTLNSYLRTSGGCSNEEWLFSQTNAVDFACPQPDCDIRGGIEFSDFSLQRTNFGFPDNDNNGVADISGSIDLSKIRRDLAMPGDTIMARFGGRIIGGEESPSFQYAYAVDTIVSGAAYLKNLYARVEIYLWGSSTPYYVCNNVPIQGTGAVRKVDASISSLNEILPLFGYYEYIDGDSLAVYMYYKVNDNPGANYLPIETRNGFYLSDVENPASAADRYTCGNNMQGNITVVGYETGSSGPQTYSSVGNGNIVTSMDHYLSFAGTAAGGKPFINEYRPISIHDELQYTVPANYEYVSATVTYHYTTGIGASASKTVAVTPVNGAASPLVFNIANLFQNGTFPVGDQGSSLSLDVTIKPGCEAPPSSEALFRMSQVEAPGFNAGFLGSLVNEKDSIYLIAPEIIASTANMSPTSTDATISWEIQISNPTIATATRVWMAKAGASGITITSVQRLSGPGGFVIGTIAPTGGGIYQLGTLTQTSNYYRINATYTSCEKDSMNLAYWYDCAGTGYPSNTGSAAFKKEIQLSVIPLQPALQTSIIGEPSGGTYDFCDVLNYEIETINTGASAVSDLTVTVALPAVGTSYVPGSFQLEYPAGSGSYISVSDTYVNESGSSIVFTIPSDEIVQLMSTEGFRIKFGLTTACAFASGGSFKFYATGSAFCGTVHQSAPKQTQKVSINGIPQYTNIYSISSVTTAGLLDCTTGDIVATYKFKIINQGPLPTTTADGFTISLPSPWELDVSSISYAHDPAGASYTGFTGGVYNFLMGAGVGAGDSVVFTATVRVPAAVAATYPTGTSAATTEQAVIRYGGVCSQTGVTCPVTEVVLASQNTTTFNFAGGQTGQPVITITNPAPVCAPAVANITLPAVTAGSTPGLTYTYYTDAAGTSVLANPSAIATSGTYYIKGTTSGGCFDIKPVTVLINPAPEATISYNGSPFCNGGTVAVIQTGQTGGTYSSTAGLSINPTTGTINLSASTPGTYQVTYNFSNGTCSGTAITSVVIGVMPVASISYPNSPYCASGAGTNIATVSRTGQAGGVYSSTAGLVIDPSTGAVDVGASTPGTYTVTYTISSGTCSASPSTSIVIGGTLNLNVTNPAPVCAPATVDLTADAITAGSSAGLSFQYYTDAAGANPLSNPAAIAASGTYYIQGVSAGGCTTPIMPVTVVINPAPTASISYNGAPFCGTGTVAVTQTGQGGGTFSSSAGLVINSTTGEINIGASTPGTYTITYSFSNGSCNNTAITTIQIISPVLTTHNPAPVCAPATVDLTAAAITAGSTAGLSFHYYTDAAGTTAIANPEAVATSGTYYIQGYSASGCETTIEPVVVTIHPVPVASISYPGSPYCQALSNIAPVTHTGYTGGAYSSTAGLVIDPVTGTVNVASSIPGTYTVTYSFTNGTCPNTTTASITIVTNPLLVINNPAPVCAPATVDLTSAAITAGSTPGLNFNYFTDAAGTSVLANPSAVSVSGTYYIQGTTPAGCNTIIGAVTVVINPMPVASISYPGSPFCNAGSVSVTQTGQTGGSYSANGGLVINPSTGEVNLGSSAPGSYTISYTISNGTCTNTVTTTLTIAAPPTLAVNDPAPVCAPATVDLTAAAITAGSTPGLTLTYFTDAAATTPLADPTAVTASGTYYIQGTNAGGCKVIMPVTVAINPVPVASISYAGSPFCNGGTANVTRTGQAGGTYSSTTGLSIDPTTGAINVSASTPGTYTVSYNFSNGSCTNTATTTVVIASTPVLVITNPAPVCAPATVDLTAAAITAGSTPGLTLAYFTDAAATTPLADPTAVTASGTYYIQGTNAGGCKVIMPVTVAINPAPVASISYAGSPFCNGGTANVTRTGQAGGTYSSSAGLSIDPTTGAINVSASTPGTYTVSYNFSNGSCTNTATTTVVIASTPVLVITNPAPVCAPATVDLTAAAITAGSTPGLTLAYFTDAAATTPLADPTAVTASGTYYIQGTNAGGCKVIMPVTVAINPVPVAAISYAGSPFCTAGIANVTQTGQAGGTYSSSAGLSIDAATGAIDIGASTPGTYTVNYTVSNGSCTNTATTAVVIASVPVLVVTNPAPVCTPATVDLRSGAITAGSTPGLSFNYYTDAAGTNVLTNPDAVSVSGTYYIQGVTPAGCRSSILPVNVTVNSLPGASISYSGSPYCPALVATASVTHNGQAGGVYSSTAGLAINTATGEIDIIASTPGTYTVTYTFSNGLCSNTATASVTINPLPVLLITNPQAVCAPGTVDITAPSITAGSTPGLVYNYFIDPAGSIKLSSPSSVATTGTYYVQGTTPSGCFTEIKAIEVTVNLAPIATITYNSSPFCINAGGTGLVTQTGISGGTYSSTPAGLAMNSTTGAIDIAASTPGVYTITYSFNNGLCSNTTQTTVSIMPKPVLMITDPAPACMPNTVDLTAAAVTAGSTAGLTFEYFTDAACTVPLSNPSSVSASGIYYIRGVYTASGCVTDVKPVQVTINSSPAITVSGAALICRGESVTLTASSPGNTIVWQNIGAGNSVIVNPQVTTTYTAIATNTAGCSVSAEVQVQVRDFDMTLIASNNPVMPGTMVTLTSGANSSYTVTGWKPESSFTAQTAIAQSFIMKDSSQTFAVIGRSADGCLDTATLFVELAPGDKDFFIPNAFTPNNDGKNDTFKPYGSSIKSIEMRVFNQWGELVYETKDKNKGWDGTFKGKAQPVGVYPYGIKVTFLDNTTTIRRGTVNLVR